MIEFGRLLIIIGLVIVLAGVLVLVAARFFPWLGHLPGDIRIETEKVKLFFPLATMLLVSLLGSVLLNVVLRIFHKN
ncbi:MAG: DUF2905 domain-containing protein [Ardenticatenaceae bacterium]|nr:DUF2905 domain-containing protein [Ardenticatenaceae bacterium]MCB8991111.1 DUF2905 domain-containing protein [Ardenticatenaceae bacterium]MCB9005267.1 DUF2905 domain-containing protein [Ardenticatenaceae bacterium]